MAHYEQTVGGSDEWYTPPHVFTAMQAQFDLDVASPGREVVPWIPTRTSILRNSLEQEWIGFVWCNPPFGPRNGLVPWIKKFFDHGNGVLLVPDQTSAPWWQTASRRADLVMFCAPRLKFIKPDGTTGVAPATGTNLMAIGERGVLALECAKLYGLGTLMRP